jgi:hypothetical protein
MKILLAQSEIAQIVQQALVDYISQKLVISEGTEIQVTMTDDGATIDLIQTNEPKPQVKKTTAPAKAETNVKSFTPKKTAPTPVVEEAVTQTTEADTVPFDVTEPVTETGTITESAAEPEADAIEAEAAEAAPPVRSLFANLRKPVN